MVSALTILLGCWLAGHSRAWGGREFLKPTIWVSPSRVVALGGSVTIRCEGRYRSMKFFLRKAGHPNPQVQTVPDGTVAEFRIPSVGWEHGGSYTCEYHPTTEQSRWSYPSDPVEIIVADPSLPRPSITLSPTGVTTPGADITIRCQGPYQVVRFFLHKAGDLNPQRHMDPAGAGAEFHIPTVGQRHGGSYSCSYRPRSEPFVSSYPSDPVQLVVAVHEFLKPTVWVSPSRVVALGGSVTIRCEGWQRSMKFFLRKAGHPNPQERTVPDGTVAEFPIPSVGRENGGSYTCEYQSSMDQSHWSYPSDPVEIIVGEPSYPKPSISLSPSGGVSLGGAVAVWCRGQRWGMRFVLNKERRHFPPVDSDGFQALFPISNVRREDGGSYSCSYHSTSEPFAVSYPSDPVVLVVRDPSLPRPSISLSSTWVTAPGADVTIRCQGQRRDVRFFLHKAGDLNPQRHMDPAGDGAEFHIPTVGRQHGGNYSCSYRPGSEPFVSSQPSDLVQLLVAEPSYPKPSISLSPSGGVSLGRAVIFRCWGQRRGMRFVLNKEGCHFPPVDSDGFQAEFPISNMRRKHGGSYSCSYHSRSELVAVSYPSDPVELVVRDPNLRKPSISLRPTGVTAPGADVTIRCQGRRRDVRFFLHKAGDLNPQRHMDPAGDGAEFRIPTMGRQHGGNYSCSYRPRSEPFVSSWPSDPVQLVVAEPSLPKPSVSVRPSQGVAPGGNATIRCRARPQNATFLLYKDGGYWGHAAPVGDVAEFPMASAGWEDTGSYSCSYHTTREPVAVSHPSDPAQLVVRVEGPRSASPHYTRGNIVRLVLSAGVLLGLALILAKAAHEWRRGRR
ncbi:immunoglobulin superfamily member 1-like [Macrochelys suwanniensis]